MKNYFLMCIFLVAMFAIGCSSPPTSAPKPDTSTSLSVHSSGQAVQAPVMFVQDNVVPDTPVDNNSPDYLFTSIAGILVTIYEIVVRLIPTTKSISALAFIYKILNSIIPDRSNSGGTFRIRDKL